jgi:hypothetical protein
MTAPVFAGPLSVEFGADTQTGGGGLELSRYNSGGAIAGGGLGTSNIIVSGDPSNHWHISSLGILTPKKAGWTAKLSGGPYTLIVRVFDNNANSVDVTLNITISPGTQHIGVLTAGNTYNPSTSQQMLNATFTTTNNTTNGSTTYGGASGAVTIKCRPGTLIPAWNNSFFASNTRTGIITITCEDFANPLTWTCINPNTTQTNRRWSPFNVRFEGVDFYFPVYRFSARETTSVGLSSYPAMNGNCFGTVEFYKCKLRATPRSVIGSGAGYRGIWGANSPASSATNVLFDSCEWSGYWYRTQSAFLTGNIQSYTYRNCILAGAFGDGLQITGTVSGYITIDGCTIHQMQSDKYTVNFTPTNGVSASLSKASLAGQVDGTKCLIAIQLNYISASARILDYAGITVRTDASRNLVVTVKDTAAATIGTLTTAPIRMGCRNSILISIDTTATSRVSIYREDDLGAGAWTDEAFFAGASQVVDMTGTVTVGGNATSASGLGVTWIAAWQGQTADTTDAAVRSGFFNSDGNATNASHDASQVTYGGVGGGSLMLDLWGDWVTKWSQGVNNAGTGNLTVAGVIEAAHGDLIQLVPGANIANVTITNNKLIGYNDDAEDNGRYNYDGYQLIFMEDAHATVSGSVVAYNYTNVRIENNLGVTGKTVHGISLYNPVNSTIRKNTIQRDENVSGTGGAAPAIYIRKDGAASGSTGSGNVIEKNVAYGLIGYTDTGWGTLDAATDLTVTGATTGANARANLFAGDGGLWDFSNVTKATAALARKIGGPLAIGDIGANFATGSAGSAPVNTIAPTISPGSNNYVGSTGTVIDFGTWLNGVNSYNVNWQKDGANVGTTASSKLFDSAGDWRIALSATNANGTSGVVYSNVITILALPTAVANNDFVATGYAQAVAVDPTTNDVGLDTVVSVTGGSPLISASKSGNLITVTPLIGFSGQVDFTVNLSGASGAVTRSSILSVLVADTKTFAITTS